MFFRILFSFIFKVGFDVLSLQYNYNVFFTTFLLLIVRKCDKILYGKLNFLLYVYKNKNNLHIIFFKLNYLQIQDAHYEISVLRTISYDTSETRHF